MTITVAGIEKEIIARCKTAGLSMASEKLKSYGDDVRLQVKSTKGEVSPIRLSIELVGFDRRVDIFVRSPGARAAMVKYQVTAKQDTEAHEYRVNAAVECFVALVKKAAEERTMALAAEAERLQFIEKAMPGLVSNGGSYENWKFANGAAVALASYSLAYQDGVGIDLRHVPKAKVARVLAAIKRELGELKAA